MKKILYISFFFSVLSFGQQRKVSGIVKDSIGEIIPGVTIIIEGTNRGTNTDFEGKYFINANPNEFLIFSFIGKKNQRINADKIEVNVQLMDDSVKLIEGSRYIPNYRDFRSRYMTVIGKSPRYNFKYNLKRHKFIIYLNKKTNNNGLDIEFTEKYNILYSGNECCTDKYCKKHNTLTFKLLNKRYGKNWQSEINKSAIGLDDFLK